MDDTCFYYFQIETFDLKTEDRAGRFTGHVSFGLEPRHSPVRLNLTSGNPRQDPQCVGMNPYSRTFEF